MTKARDLANSAAAFASVSATELGYVDGVTSAIQTQMDAKAPSSTAATLSGTQTLTNKTIDTASNTITGAVTLTGTQTLTNKTIDTASNTITGAVTLTGTQTLTNKTLTSPVIASVINNTLTSTTGDIIYASAANTPARLGIGSASQVLSVSGGIPAWSTPASSGSMTLISSTALSGTSVSFTSITGTYKNLYVHLSNPYASSAGGYNMTFNNDTTATNYHYFYTEPDNATLYASHTNWWAFQQGNWGFCSGGAGAASNGNAFHLWVYDYAGGTKKVYNGVGYALHNNGNSQMFPTANGVYRSNTAITRLDVRCNAGSWSGGTAYLYGVN